MSLRKRETKMENPDKNKILSLRILAEYAKGKSLPEAFDSVIGLGAYQKLAGEVWEAFQVKIKARAQA